MSSVMKEFSIRKEEIGDIGVEIEVEGRYLPRLSKFWKNDQDGSLKGEESMEYVLAKPSSLKGVREALDYLDEAYKRNESVVDDTVRAGVHIHINCQRLTMTQLYNFITMYLIFENLLVRWCGEYREGNLFCLRSCDAEWSVMRAISAASNKPKNFRRDFHIDELRYSSMNLKALGDYGSLEFRAMRGTRNLDLIYSWAETLLNLRDFACTFDRPPDIIHEFSVTGAHAFTKRALSNNFKMFREVSDDWMNMVMAGMRNAQDVAFCTDWSMFEPKMKLVGGLEFPEYMKDEEINEPLEDA